MSELVNELTSRTGISPELVQKGLGPLLSFLKKELGEETFGKLQSSIPDASRLTSQHESSAESHRSGGAVRDGFGPGGQIARRPSRRGR